MTELRELDRLDNEALWRGARAAARIGEDEEARRYLVELTARTPDDPEAWLELGGVEEDPRRKRDCFARALELRPGDTEAQAGLDRLARKYGASILQPDDGSDVMHCTWHPERETLLRCSRCGRPMCASCAHKHPVGMRCKECIKELRPPHYVVSPGQLAVASVAAVALGALAGGIMLFVVRSFGIFGWFVAFLAGAGVGAAIADAASRASGGKRGRSMQVIVAAGIVGGVGVWGFGVALVNGAPWPAAVGLAVGSYVNIGALIYLFTSVSAALARLR